MTSTLHPLESPQETLERFMRAPADVSYEELQALFTWLAEDPMRLSICDDCDPSVAANRVRHLADLVGKVHRIELTKAGRSGDAHAHPEAA
jgi:hypothetical protein